MNTAIYFGAFRDMGVLLVNDLNHIKHFIMVDQLPIRVKYFEPEQCGYTTAFNEQVFISELYHQLREHDFEIVEMIKRDDFVKFLIKRNCDITIIDYYYNTTLEDALTITDIKDILQYVNTLILCGFCPFNPHKNENGAPTLTFDDIPRVQDVWFNCSDDCYDYNKTGLYMSIEEFKDIFSGIYEGEWTLYWWENADHTDISESEESDIESEVDE